MKYCEKDHKQVASEITPKLKTIVKDYFQEMTDDESAYLVKRTAELLQNFKWADEKHFDSTHRELLKNYPLYKRINVATFMTAFYKANLKSTD